MLTLYRKVLYGCDRIFGSETQGIDGEAIIGRFKKDTPELEAASLDSVTSLYRFHVGEHEIIVINDGFIGLTLSLVTANAPEEDVLALMRAHGLGTEFAPLPVGIVLFRTGDRLVLVDRGTGTSDFARDLFGGYIGGVVPTLELRGVSPAAINTDGLWMKPARRRIVENSCSTV